ncbi:MAG TPA: ATP-binding protein [Kofleriaceae bacterium]
MHAVILERNKLVGRKVARLFLSVGATAVVVEEPKQVASVIADADVLCADAFDGDFVAEAVRSSARLHGVLWTAEPLRRSLKFLVETTRINDVLGRRDFDSAPRSWEILMVARRLAGNGSTAPPLAGYLDWGYASLDLDVRSTADRDAATAKIQTFVGTLQLPKRVAEMFGELAHELLMNAMYDAPVDAQGNPKYAGDRKADIKLADNERPIVRVATDGTCLALQVRDPFGRLERRHVFDGLARGLAGGEMDQSHGGAGLGMMVCHNSSSAMFFDVARGRSTEVTALFDLDMNLRELRTQAKSLHFWST